MVTTVTLQSRIFKELNKTLDAVGSYSFDVKDTRAHRKVYEVGNVIRAFECAEHEFHPITTPKNEKTEHKRILHNVTGKELRSVVSELGQSQTEGYLKITLIKE